MHLFVIKHRGLLVALVFCCTLLQAWFIPGLILSEDFQQPSAAVLSAYFPWPSSWDHSINLGYSQQLWWPIFPIRAVAGLLSRIGLGWEFSERLLWLWPLLIFGTVGSYFVFLRTSRSTVAAGLSAIVFTVNPWTVALLQRGHNASLIAYSLFPLCTVAWLRAMEMPSPARSLIAGALLTVEAAYDIRYCYMQVLILVACLAARAFSIRRRRAKAALGGVALSGTFFLIFFSYWWLPSVFARPQLPDSYTTLFWLSAANHDASWPRSLALVHPYYQHMQNTDPFAPAPPDWWFFGLPLIAFLGFLARRGAALSVPLACCAVAAVLLSAGPQSATGFLSVFAFTHVPGFSMFRDLAKLYAVTSFVYAWMIAYALSTITKKAAQPVSIAMLLASASLWLLAMNSAFSPARGGPFSISHITPAEAAVERDIQQAAEGSRVIFFPAQTTRIPSSPAHPIISSAQTITSPSDGLGNLSPAPLSLLALYQTPYAQDLIRDLGVSKVVVQGDPLGNLYRPFSYDVKRGEALRVFERLPWLRRERIEGDFEVYDVRDSHPPLGFVATEPVLVDGYETAAPGLSLAGFLEKHSALLDARDPGARTALPLVRNCARSAATPESADRYERAPLDISRFDAQCGSVALLFSRSAMSTGIFDDLPKQINERFVTQRSLTGIAHVALRAAISAAPLRPSGWSVTSEPLPRGLGSFGDDLNAYRRAAAPSVRTTPKGWYFFPDFSIEDPSAQIAVFRSVGLPRLDVGEFPRLRYRAIPPPSPARLVLAVGFEAPRSGSNVEWRTLVQDDSTGEIDLRQAVTESVEQMYDFESVIHRGDSKWLERSKGSEPADPFGYRVASIAFILVKPDGALSPGSPYNAFVDRLELGRDNVAPHLAAVRDAGRLIDFADHASGAELWGHGFLVTAQRGRGAIALRFERREAETSATDLSAGFVVPLRSGARSVRFDAAAPPWWSVGIDVGFAERRGTVWRSAKIAKNPASGPAAFPDEFVGAPQSSGNNAPRELDAAPGKITATDPSNFARRYAIDLKEVADAYDLQLADAKFLRLSFSPSAALTLFPEQVYTASASDFIEVGASAGNDGPVVTVDGRTFTVQPSSPAFSLSLQPGAHHLSARPSGGYDVDAVAIAGTGRTRFAEATCPMIARSDSELSCDSSERVSGLLVLPEAFDSGWRVWQTPSRSFSPSGNVVGDVWQLWSEHLSAVAPYRINHLYMGFPVQNAQHVVAIYIPEFWNRVAACVWLALSGSAIAITYIAERRSRRFASIRRRAPISFARSADSG